MGQFLDSIYKWQHEGEYFVVADVDPNYFTCRYLGSQWGFVMDKEIFAKHLSKGKIETYSSNQNLAV